MSNDETGVQSLSVIQLSSILQDPLRSNYQIIDVRDPQELLVAKLKDSEVINLPLSQMSVWSESVKSGEVLDKNKQTICMCKHGKRSMVVATFLTSEAGFKKVLSVEGGINQYSLQIDPTIPTY